MIHGFASGEFAFMDSSEFDLWSDRDDTPVSNRNYAYSPFRFDSDEYVADNIIDELDGHFDRTGWHVHPTMPWIAEADDTVSVWPYIVRRRIVLMEKYYDHNNGWSERSYNVPVVGTEEMMESHIRVKVWIDCD